MPQDFVIDILPAESDRVYFRITSPFTPTGKLFGPYAPLVLDAAQLDQLRRQDDLPAIVPDLQVKITEWLLPNEIRPLLTNALNLPDTLRIVLNIDERLLPTMSDVPFELVAYSANVPLILHPKVASLVQLLPKMGQGGSSYAPNVLPQQWPLSVLLIRSSPADLKVDVPLGAPIRDEILQFAQMLSDAAGQPVDSLVRVDLLSREEGALGLPTWRTVRDQLRRAEYDILVYLGHGDLKSFADRDSGVLLLEDETGKTNYPISAPNLQVALQSPPIPVVLLMGCHTAQAGNAATQRGVAKLIPEWMRGSQGVAQALVTGPSGVQIALGMRYLLSTVAAQVFLSAFFRHLLGGQGEAAGDVELAIRAAREDLFQDNRLHGTTSWAASVVFRVPSAGPLFPFLGQILKATPSATRDFIMDPEPPTKGPTVKGYSSAEGINTRDLYRKLADRTSLDDLRDICFFMEIDDESIGAKTKPEFIRELLSLLERQGRVDEFITVVKAEKPWVLR